jgi:hypothetical protein
VLSDYIEDGRLVTARVGATELCAVQAEILARGADNVSVILHGRWATATSCQTRRCAVLLHLIHQLPVGCRHD